MAIATDIISDSIQETKKTFFPIDKKFWLKIGLVSLLDHRGSSNFNFRGTRMANPGEFTKFTTFIKTHIGLILGISSGVIILSLLFSIISFTFNFVFLESLFSRRVLIKKYFNKFVRKGLSLFWLNLVLNAANLVFLLILGMPLIIPLIKNWGSLSWSQFSIPYLIFFVIIFILDLIIFVLIDFVINNFIVVDMYTRNTTSFQSLNKMLKLIKIEFFESFIYLLMKIVLGIATAIISLVVGLISLLAIVIIGIILALILYLIYLGLPQAKIILIIIGIIIAILLMLILIYAIAVILSPIEGFYYTYSYKFFKELKARNKMLFKNAKQ